MRLSVQLKKSNVPPHFLVIDLALFVLVAYFTFRVDLPAIYFVFAVIYLGIVERLDTIIERM